MKLFGEYLVEKNLVTPEVLVDSLIEQLKGLPSISEILRKENLLQAGEILKIYHHETQNGVSFVAAAQALGCWNDKMEATVEKQLRALRVPIGQILVRKGALTPQKLTEALDEFLGENATGIGKKAPPASPKPVTAPAMAVEEGGISDQQLKKIGLFFDGLMMEPPKPESFKPIIDELHVLRGSARLIGAAKFEALLVGLEKVSTSFVALKSPTEEQLGSLAFSGAEAAQVVRRIGSVVSQGQTEESYFSDPTKTRGYQDVLNLLEQSLSDFNPAK